MIPEAILIARSEVDWPTYLLACKQVLGRSISVTIDSNNLKLDNLNSFLVSIAELKNPKIKLTDFYNSPSNLLEHVSFSFLVASDTKLVFDLMQETDLTVTSERLEDDRRLSVVTGSLHVWKAAIVSGCSELVGKNLRTLLDKCLLIFEANGLGQFWCNYQKVPLRDQTFKLMEKP